MIVLAGGIGSGKSVVARILRLEGFGVFDCDLEARALMEGDSHLSEEIMHIAGRGVYINGKIDRKALGHAIYSDETVRTAVNAAVHAAVRERIKKWRNEADKNIFVETAIAGVSGLAALADEVWIMETPEETRIERVKVRDGRPREEILKIMEIQAEEEGRILSAGVPVKRIVNDESKSLLMQIREQLNTI